MLVDTDQQGEESHLMRTAKISNNQNKEANGFYSAVPTKSHTPINEVGSPIGIPSEEYQKFGIRSNNFLSPAKLIIGWFTSFVQGTRKASSIPSSVPSLIKKKRSHMLAFPKTFCNKKDLRQFLACNCKLQLIGRLLCPSTSPSHLSWKLVKPLSSFHKFQHSILKLSNFNLRGICVVANTSHSRQQDSDCESVVSASSEDLDGPESKEGGGQ